MTKKSLLAICVLTLVAGTATDAFACGDKFLVRSRGTRFQRAPAARTPAAILVYANPASSLPQALTNVPVETTLRKAGYRPTSVATIDELEAALREGSFDLVLADLAEAQAVRERLQGKGRSIVLPVAFNAPAAVIRAAKQQYRILLKAPTRIEAFLETIDDAVALTQKLQDRR